MNTKIIRALTVIARFGCAVIAFVHIPYDLSEILSCFDVNFNYAYIDYFSYCLWNIIFIFFLMIAASFFYHIKKRKESIYSFILIAGYFLTLFIPSDYWVFGFAIGALTSSYYLLSVLLIAIKNINVSNESN